jgi:hypothetical protein
MGGRKHWKSLKLTHSQIEKLNEVVNEKFSSASKFGKVLTKMGEKRKRPASHMLNVNVQKYLTGELHINPRPARTILETLRNDSRLDFLKPIAYQTLESDRPEDRIYHKKTNGGSQGRTVLECFENGGIQGTTFRKTYLIERVYDENGTFFVDVRVNPNSKREYTDRFKLEEIAEDLEEKR